MTQKEHISEKYNRFLGNQATRAEIKDLIKDFGTMDEQLLRLLIQEKLESEMDHSPLPPGEEAVVQKVLKNIRSSLRFRFRVYRYYAAVAIALAIGLIYYHSLKMSSRGVEKSSHVAKEIGPGYNQAVLTMADGRSVPLDSAQQGIIVRNEKVIYNDGNLVVAGDDGQGKQEPNTISYPFNTIHVPKGGQYQVTLPDGSKVWLNAATTLKYPSVFSRIRREVEIDGEAYFDIAHVDGKPFVVKTSGQEIVVLGTAFNVSAYQDDPKITTTLVRGSVKIVGSSRQMTQLKAGEQSTLSKEGVLTVAKADISHEVAWKEGLISFTDVPFAALMRQLERWYNIDVVYEGKVPEVFFEGAVKRNVTLKKLLEFFRDSGIDFSITDDRKLIINEVRKI